MTHFSKLELKREQRLGEDILGETATKTQRDFFDIVVDEVSIWSLVQKHGLDYISCLQIPSARETRHAIARLLLQSPPDAPSNRYSLYICPECGDLGCGALTVSIESLENKFIWRDFGFQNNYDDEINLLSGEIGPFTFRKEEYVTLFLSIPIDL